MDMLDELLQYAAKRGLAPITVDKRIKSSAPDRAIKKIS